MDDDRRTGAVLTIRFVAETGSTNADLLTAAAAGAPEGDWLRAGRQVAGRGRMGRTWIDGGGNLFASTIVRLRPDDPPAQTLALVAPLALFDVVDALLPGRARIKWPNDLLIGPAKLSGILLERGAGNAVVVGFGVNLAEHPDLAERPTTALIDHGILLTPRDAAERLRDRFAQRLDQWRRGGLDTIRTDWLAAAQPLGTPVRVRLPDGSERAGVFDGIEPDGTMRLREPGGTIVIVHAGDVL
ncbi:biotin--[acetyl-CoA-carboxylase] ligase [Sphingomonas sp. VNH70]|uniref:biotin--[acetyl-CoA-carboxylase] ligase n=1 Tax=Sphingomonas silueang TaxID=3156617 RepID=UPI0032B5F397